MPEMVAWALLPTFGLTLVIFGFAPPFLLRLIVQMYPRDDPRRAELMAELRARPWRERPIWIAEQLETGLVEGLGHRLRERRRRRQEQQRRLLESKLSPSSLVPPDVEVVEISIRERSVRVEGHMRNNGTWVSAHYRRKSGPPAP